MKNVYFLSDAHLGSRAIEHGQTERRLVNFLDSINTRHRPYTCWGHVRLLLQFRTVIAQNYTHSFWAELSRTTDLG